MRLLLLSEGRVTSPPSWAICPGGSDIDCNGCYRLSLDGFTCPCFACDEGDGVVTIATARLRVTIRLAGLHCTWEQRHGEDWRTIAADRPTQAYNFGWWDDRTYHHVARAPGQRFYGLGDRSGDANRAGRSFRLTNLDPMGFDAENSDPLYKSIPDPQSLTRTARATEFLTTAPPTSRSTWARARQLSRPLPPYRRRLGRPRPVDHRRAVPLAVTRRFTWLTGRPAK
ncbi:hypothetical protein AB5I41_07295 [Sphingomonas sp. MMS24-JH45]